MASFVSNTNNVPDVPVKAFDFKDKEKIVGEYKSLGEAARKLYIRNSAQIHSYLFRKKENARGVSNYKTDTKYHFELSSK